MDIVNGIYELLGMPTEVRCARRSPKWSKLRADHLKIFPRCEACGDAHKPKEVHHVVPVHIDPAKELDVNNLMTLCAEPCHLVFGHLYAWARYNPDAWKDCVAWKAKVVAAADAARNFGRIL